MFISRERPQHADDAAPRSTKPVFCQAAAREASVTIVGDLVPTLGDLKPELGHTRASVLSRRAEQQDVPPPLLGNHLGPGPATKLKATLVGTTRF